MLRKLALAAASTLVALAALEVLLRVTGLGVHDHTFEWAKYGQLLVRDETGGYLRHSPGTQIVLHGVAMQFNSLGMRDAEPAPKRPGRTRILCLGDSYTVGPGVAQDAIYPARLRALLAADGTEVIAAGVGGWNTVAEERFLAAHIDRLAPDVVVLLYVINDIEIYESFANVHEPPTGVAAHVYRVLVRESRLFELAAWVYQTRVAPIDRETAQRLIEWERLQDRTERGFDPQARGWRESRAALGRIAELTRARGAALVVVLANQWGRPIERAALARLRDFGREHGVPVIDGWPFWNGQRVAALVNDGMRDPHPNARGHALLAEGIARTLRAERLVGQAPG